MPWLCGLRKGMELMLTGDTLNGHEAVECGWATRCFPDAKLEEETLRIATNGASAGGHPAGEQALDAQRHGGHGHSHRSSLWHGAAGACYAHEGFGSVHEEVSSKPESVFLLRALSLHAS